MYLLPPKKGDGTNFSLADEERFRSKVLQCPRQRERQKETKAAPAQKGCERLDVKGKERPDS